MITSEHRKKLVADLDLAWSSSKSDELSRLVTPEVLADQSLLSEFVMVDTKHRGDRRLPVSLALYREMVPGLQPGMEAVVLILIQEIIDQTLAGAVAIDEAGCELSPEGRPSPSRGKDARQSRRSQDIKSRTE